MRAKHLTGDFYKLTLVGNYVIDRQIETAFFYQAIQRLDLTTKIVSVFGQLRADRQITGGIQLAETLE